MSSLETGEVAPAVPPEAPTISSDKMAGEGACFSITVVSTGGTISKTYDQQLAVMHNSKPMAVRIIQSLRLPGLKIKYRNLFNKDSLQLTKADRQTMIRSIQLSASRNDAVIVLHGTDTMAETADALLTKMPKPRVPIIFTGAMTPYVIEGSDGLQNVTEAIFACRLLEPGVYIVFHGRAMRCPGVRKDYEALTFVRERPGSYHE